MNGKRLRPDKLLEKLNILAGKNGIGRVDLRKLIKFHEKGKGLISLTGVQTCALPIYFILQDVRWHLSGEIKLYINSSFLRIIDQHQ